MNDKNSLRDYAVRWDKLATDNVYTVICNPGGGKSCSEEEFNLRGKEDASFIVPYIGSDKTILDFGCGIGRIMKYLAPSSKFIWGVDISPVMIEKGKKFLFGISKARLQLISGGKLPFTEGQFDVAYSWYCLQHMDKLDAYNYCKEIFRVVKKGGILLATFPSLFSESYFKHWEGLKTTEPARVRIYTKPEVGFKLKKIGFKKISSVDRNEDFIIYARK